MAVLSSTVSSKWNGIAEKSLAACPAGGGTEQALELARKHITDERQIDAFGACGEARPCGCPRIFPVSMHA